MSTSNIIKVIISIIIFVLIQLLIVKSMVLFSFGFCFVYLGAILFLPTEMSRTWVLLTSFFIGLTIDVFYNTGGLHAFTTVFIGFTRLSYLRMSVSSLQTEKDQEVDFKKIAVNNKVIYILIAVFIHHLLLFFIENASLLNIDLTFIKVIISTVFSVLVIFLTHIILEGIQN